MSFQTQSSQLRLVDARPIATAPVLGWLSAALVLAIPFFDVPRLGIRGVPVAAYPAMALVVAAAATGVMRIPKVPTLIFWAFWTVYSLSFLVNSVHLDERASHHVLLYALSFLWFYVAPYQAYIHLGLARTQRLFFWGVLCLALVGTLEVAFFYLYGFQAYATFLNHDENVGVLAGLLPRMRSLFNEPSHLAIYVIGVAPVVWNVNRLAKIVVVYLLVWTFSASAWVGLFCAFIGFVLYRFLFSKRASVKVAAIVLIVLVALLWEPLLQLPIFEKVAAVFWSGHATTEPPRYLGLIKSLRYLDASPLLGLGPTYYYSYIEGGLFNLYLQLYIEAGLLGLALFLAFFITHFRGTPTFRSPAFFVPFFGLLVQYAGMNHYYIPGLWVMLSYMSYLTAEGKPGWVGSIHK